MLLLPSGRAFVKLCPSVFQSERNQHNEFSFSLQKRKASIDVTIRCSAKMRPISFSCKENGKCLKLISLITLYHEVAKDIRSISTSKTINHPSNICSDQTLGCFLSITVTDSARFFSPAAKQGEEPKNGCAVRRSSPRADLLLKNSSTMCLLLYCACPGLSRNTSSCGNP